MTETPKDKIMTKKPTDAVLISKESKQENEGKKDEKRKEEKMRQLKARAREANVMARASAD